jgi:hypothetical protein
MNSTYDGCMMFYVHVIYINIYTFYALCTVILPRLLRYEAA